MANNTENEILLYVETMNKSSTEKNRLLRLLSYEKNFLELGNVSMGDLKMKNLLIEQLKLDKYSSVNNYLHTLSSFFQYEQEKGNVKFNIFESEILQRQYLNKAISRNVFLITEEVLEEAFEQLEKNRHYIEAANRLVFECVVSNFFDIAYLNRECYRFNTKTINGIKVSERLIRLLEEVKYMSGWERKDGRLSPMTSYHDSLFKYAVKSEQTQASEERFKWFLTQNCILEYKGIKLDSTKLYCSGLLHKIVAEFGKDYFIENFTSGKKDTWYIEQVIEKFKLKENAYVLKKNLKPYALNLKGENNIN